MTIKSFNWTKGWGMRMCECVGVGECAELWFWAQEEREKAEIREKKERGGRKMGIKWGRYRAVQPKDRERKRSSALDGQLGTDPFFPQRGCQPSLSQYNTNQCAACSILVHNNMVSSWCSYRWQALINTTLIRENTEYKDSHAMLSCGNTHGIFQMPCSSQTTDRAS